MVIEEEDYLEMTSEEFRKNYPEFKHRLVVSKSMVIDDVVPLVVKIKYWLLSNIGQRGDRWEHQSMASPIYLVYWFREEDDLLMAKLRWS